MLGEITCFYSRSKQKQWTSEGVGVAVNTEKSKYMFICGKQNHDMKVANKLF
jgi:hypothetical protein